MRRASCATEGQEITLPMRVWRATGSHELFASLGFDLMEVGQLEITLRTGKQASRRSVQFALQALIALFGKYTDFSKKKKKYINRYLFYWHEVNFFIFLKRYPRDTKKFKLGFGEFDREFSIRNAVGNFTFGTTT